MSVLAEDLITLLALPTPHGTLTEHLLREIARFLIAGDDACSASACNSNALSRAKSRIAR